MHAVGELSGLQNGIWNSETLPGIQLVPYVLQGKIGTEEQKVDSSLALAHFQAASGIWVKIVPPPLHSHLLVAIQNGPCHICQYE